MFTGIVEELGSVRAVEPAAFGVRLRIGARVVTHGARAGDSIALNGCCLTVVGVGPGWWDADVVPETLDRTNLGILRPGDAVNLERPVPVGGRLGGHIVQGHVDGTGTIEREAPNLVVSASPWILRYLVPKGSVTVDGVSLTVVSVTASSFAIAVIPHTMHATTLGRRSPGEPVNLEVDVIAKYAERLLQGGVDSPYADLLAGRS